MPGGRLTRQDRQHIASGLAQGLGYAEIARSLGRPTSTISREVSRNGGPGDYRADHAHRAAGRRARRRPVTPAPTVPAIDTYGRDPEAVRAFEERLTATMIASGLPSMYSRVLVVLLTCDADGMTAAELVQRLHVSPASVSKAVRYLEEQVGCVRRVRDPGQRRERYVIDDDVWYTAWTRAARTHRMWADSARQGAEIFGPATAAGRRLDDMSMFFDLVSRDIARAADHWWQVLRARRQARDAQRETA